jgi:metal-responsive CopG/Arc/MetJ family transcriptional regulator
MTEPNYKKLRTTPIVIRISPKDLKEWDRYAKRAGVSRSQLIRKAVNHYILVDVQVTFT